jgi:hypothetical protein
MTKINLLTASILATTLGLSACSNDNHVFSKPESPDVVDQQPLIKGTVTDASGTPLVDATVSVGSQTLTTDHSGAYSTDLKDLTDSDAKVVVLIKKPGYLTTARELTILPDHSYNLDISLTEDQVTTAFDSRAGLTALPVSGAKVTIPAGSVVKLDGSDFAGTVTIAANYYNPDSIEGMQAFAQPFTGQDADGSNQTDLVTIGVIDVKLTDPTTGAELDLKDGETATLSFPEASTDQDLATIPLWYYDEEKLIWVKDGAATRQADGSYQSEVSHFTLWNVDIPVSEYPATIKGCVIDKVTQQPFTDNFYAFVQGRGYINGGTADSEGKFDIQVPFNTPLLFYPHRLSVNFDRVEIPALAKDATYQLNGGQCIEVTAAAPSDELLDFNQALNDTLMTLPPAPVDVTPTNPDPNPEPQPEPQPKPTDPFKRPTQENTVGLIGYNFDFDLNDDDKLENVIFGVWNNLNGNIRFTFESLYLDIDYRGYEEFINALDFFRILTRQGVSQGHSITIIDNNKLEYELLGSSVRGNQFIQSLDNGFKSIHTHDDKSISGMKIGDVLSYNIDEDEFPKDIVNNLNNIPFSKGTFTGAAGCKVTRSINNNVDFITFGGPGSSSNFEYEVDQLDLNPTRGTWAGVPWAIGNKADEDGDFPAIVNYNTLVYDAEYTKNGFVNLSLGETTECSLYNEAAKEQIFEALSTAYPKL